MTTAEDNLPVLNEPIITGKDDDLPVLTDIIHVPNLVTESLATHHVVPEPCPPNISLSEEAYQQLVERLEDHLENLLNQKITAYLDRLKLHLIEQVVEEVKRELSDPATATTFSR